jgi:nucleoside-diphosphate-sugar epimerase
MARRESMLLPTRDLDHVTASVGDAWETLRSARVFVTGGTGFFGKWLVESFLHANRALGLNAQLVVLTRRPDAFPLAMPHLADQPDISFHGGDVRDFDFPAGRFSHVIHAATPSWGLPEQGHEQWLCDTIVGGTRRVLDFVERSGVARLLFTSSGAVYGPQPPHIGHVSEGYLGAPSTVDTRSTYGHAKRFAEHLGALHAARTGLRVMIARCFAFVGPYLPMDAHFAIGNFIRDGLAGDEIRVSGDGTPFRSYLYAADLAVWLWTILLRGESCRPYNVGAEQEVSIADLAREVAAAFDPSPAVIVVRPSTPGAAASRYIPLCLRAREELGLETRISRAEGIRRTVDWHTRLDFQSRAPGGRYTE